MRRGGKGHGVRDRAVGVLVERTATLPAVPSSVGVARGLLRSALMQTGRSRWADDGELALSEVVTNAVLHAHTEITLTVRVHPEAVDVEVWDLNPAPPLARHYEREATTGRGMALVAAVTSECGVRRLPDEGKVVWFRLGDPDPGRDGSVEELLAAWDVTGDWDLSDPGEPETRQVLLCGMPPALWLAARQHHDALLRELALYCATHDDVKVDLALADRARSRVGNALVQAVQAAQREGVASPLPAGHPGPGAGMPARVDLPVRIPVHLSPAYVALQDALDVAEDLAVAGRLLARPGLPEVVAVRDWATNQVIAQLAGAPAHPWPGRAHERFETALHERADPGVHDWDARAVADSPRPALAADDANRIVAVSRPLADLLGWRVEDLVGRRVTTIIPPRLREAHVAGFSAYLSTGERHILGVPLRLPALRADDTEIMCTLLIETASAGPTRSIFVAWIEPVPDPTSGPGHPSRPEHYGS